MDRIVALCKRRGFIFQSSEIYGGINGFWDYGPLGVELKRNLKECWWKDMVHGRDDMVGLDCSIIMHPQVWKVSGHYDLFSDMKIDCKECQGRFRADQITDQPCPRKPSKMVGQYEKCQLTDPRPFNLMFETFIGALLDEESKSFLRPETAQGIFVNFKNVCDSTRIKLPFGIAQIGKSFRNEITPRNFTFRSREFEQMEIEFFCHPGESRQWYEYWRDTRLKWYVELGLGSEKLRLREHGQEELSHYSCGTSDIEYAFPFLAAGDFGELEGVAHRGDFDLRSHMEGKLVRDPATGGLVVEKGPDGKPKYKGSGKDLTYFDDERKERFIPHVIEPSAGADRATLAFICEAYTVDESRPSPELMKFHPRLAPIKAAVFPLVNKDGLPEIAEPIFRAVRKRWVAQYDAKASIGKRYARMDEAGTPYCFTIDGQTKEDGTVTVRDRDTGAQQRIGKDQVVAFLADKLGAA
ncbi:MAG: glycine--tRNA ligase [Phycisphaerae bacterium]